MGFVQHPRTRFILKHIQYFSLILDIDFFLFFSGWVKVLISVKVWFIIEKICLLSTQLTNFLIKDRVRIYIYRQLGA